MADCGGRRLAVGNRIMKLNDKRHIILLVLYGIIVYLAIWGVTSHARDVFRLPIAVWAAIGAVGGCGAMLEILMHLRIRKALNQMKHQIEKMSQTAEVGLVMIDEQWSVEGMPSILNRYLTLIRDRMNQLKREHKELDLLVRAVDAEKHNTEAIIQSISDAVIVVNAFGELTLANQQAQELFGFELAERKSHPVEDVITDSMLLGLLSPARWENREPVRFEYELAIAGREKPGVFVITVSPVYIRKDELWALSMTLHDVTQERELAQLKNDFVNHVSHELRTPLSSIKAYVELLLDGDIQTAEGRTDFYRIIEAETDRLDRFIGNLLNLSRIESGLMSVEFTEVNLNEELRQAVELVRFIAEEKAIGLRVVSGQEPIWIRADRDLLRQVILNLLSNAIKYTSSAGNVVVTIGTDASESTCWLEVQDSGLGISEEDRGRIFDKFYRCGGSNSGGTGLGLTLVKKVVEQIHHGRIEVDSTPGTGSTFTAYLPITPEVSEMEKSEEQEILV
jgi:two-component system phosphate regulon sensor histidine kinase PhoR